MKCPSCQTENPDDNLFCRKCGEKLSISCPQCGAEVLTEDTFCGKCGHTLKESKEAPPKDLSFDEKIRKIQKYLPKGLTEKILSQRGKIEGEKKQVTVMFADMEGFTPLVNKLGPEEAYSIMDQIYEILIHKVHDYEGTVNEMTGDGIVALFGAPIALEDAPQRAIRSAHAIHLEMTRFSEKVKQEREGIQSLKMRIGIHTGPVVVGTLGNDLRVEFKAVGDTVNLASRMEDLAEPGATYVTEETFKLTEGLFRYESLGEKKVKGKEELVKAYRVIGPSTRRTRFDVSAERGLTPFVGRERELELLLDGFERVKEGRGQAFSIISEAGVGKSRLSYEFIKSIANENVTILEGKCLSYSRGVAYHPVIDVLKSNFDIREDDGDIDIKEKATRGLKILSVEETSTLPYLLEILGVKDSGIDKIPMSPEARKDRIMETVNRITIKGSEIRPLIIVVEDLHWIDKSSEEYLKILLDSIPGARVLLIFTYRPEFVHTWGGKSYHSQVTLNRLSNRESLAMVTYLLGTEEIETQLEELVLEKTEGIPFFIEEFIKSLKEINVIERKDNRYQLIKNIQDVTIPSTIQDVIMARVDSLPEIAKEVLQAGSGIEREFSYELIKRITGLPEQDLLNSLSVLKDTELLYERGIYPQSTYIFKHALTREVVYDSILIKNRKKLHEKIGKAIEELYKDNLDEYCGILTGHYIDAENYKKGEEYSKQAGKIAEKKASLTDAIEYNKKRIDCLEKLPRTEEMEKKIIDARSALGIYYAGLNYLVEAKEAVEPIVELALKRDHRRALAQIYTTIGVYSSFVEEDFPKALKYLGDSLRISEELSDNRILPMTSQWMAITLSWSCEFENSLYHFEKALEIWVAADNLLNISIAKCHIAYLVYDMQGKIDLGYKTSDEALCLAEDSGDIAAKAWACIFHGHSCYFKRLLDDAERYSTKGDDYCKRINLFSIRSYANYLLGEIYFEKGKYQESENYYKQAISLLEDNRLWPFFIKFFKIALARTKVMSNERDIDLELLYSYEAENKVKWLDGWIPRYIGEILLNIDDQRIPDAEKWLNKAIEADHSNGMMFYLGQDYALYAELFKRKGDQEKARENLGKAIEILKECGADGWVQKYEKELTSL